MIEVKDLLLRVNKLLFSEEIKREAISGVIFQVLKIKVFKDDIKIKNNIIYLSIKPLYKNEIFIKKNQILSELRSVLGNKTPRDIN